MRILFSTLLLSAISLTASAQELTPVAAIHAEVERKCRPITDRNQRATCAFEIYNRYEGLVGKLRKAGKECINDSSTSVSSLTACAALMKTDSIRLKVTSTTPGTGGLLSKDAVLVPGSSTLSIATPTESVSATVTPTAAKVSDPSPVVKESSPRSTQQNGLGIERVNQGSDALIWISIAGVTFLIAVAGAWIAFAAGGRIKILEAKIKQLEGARVDADVAADATAADLIKRIDSSVAAVRSEMQRALSTFSKPNVAPSMSATIAPASKVSQKTVERGEVTSNAEPQVELKFELANATDDVLAAIKQLASDDSQITEANAVVRILASVKDLKIRQGLEASGFFVRFFTAAGDPSAINAELLAWSASAAKGFFVIPHPQAGRVGQFNKWFAIHGEYATQPVLAERPAIARMESGRLMAVKLGSLR